MTDAERLVRSRWPDAEPRLTPDSPPTWAIVVDWREAGDDWWAGEGATEAEAWLDAASRLADGPPKRLP